MDMAAFNLPMLAHLLIGFYFVFFAFWNIYHWSPLLSALSEDNLPHPYLLLPIGIGWQFIAGLMIILGIWVKLAALSLIPFILIGVFICHPFWKHKGNLYALNLTIFMANTTMGIGALLLLIYPVSTMADFFS